MQLIIIIHRVMYLSLQLISLQSIIYLFIIDRISNFQVKVVFLYWLPCILRMSRPSDKEEREAQKSQKPSPVTGNLVTRKSIDTSTDNIYYLFISI